MASRTASAPCPASAGPFLVRGPSPWPAAGHVAIDGKRLRGSAVGDVPGVHLLAAFSERLQGVIGQWRGAPEANEITAGLALLQTLPPEGAVLKGGAIFAPNPPLGPHLAAGRAVL